MSNLGMKVMLNQLAGNKESVDAFKAVLGKKISAVWLDEGQNTLRFEFETGEKLNMWDDGQSCCETRYMRTDDNLSEFVGAILLGAELKDAPNQEDEYGDHEVQFLDIKTDKGVFTMSNHNEHNGYYGGFSVCCSTGKEDKS